jgi:hypothetical protein
MQKRFFLLTLTCALLGNAGFSQQKTGKDFRNFPLILTLQFHSLSMPFKDLGSHFKNIGFGIGTEVSHNGNHDWVQQFGIIRYRNKAVGNGWLFSTTTAWRPYIGKPVYGEVRLGIGYQLASKPSHNWVQKDGKWISAGKKGKGMLAIPAGIAVGYHDYKDNKTYAAPFVGYQVNFLKGYSKDLPIVPQTLLQAGTGIHPQW